MAVIVGSIAPRTVVRDDNVLQLEGAFGVHALALGDDTFVYVAGLRDDGVSVFALGSDGSLTNVQNVRDNIATQYELNNAANFASANLGGVTYLYVNGAADSGVSAFRVESDGTLQNIQNITDDDQLELGDTAGKMSVTTVEGRQFLVLSGHDDNGLSVFRINADGTLSNTANITDQGALELNDAFDTATATVGGRTFVFVAAQDDDGLSVFQLNGDGTLTNTFNVSDDAALELDGAMGVATAEVGGTTYLIASGAHGDGMSVFSVNEAGQLANVFNLKDSAATALRGAAGLTTFELGGETFLLASGLNDDGLTVFHLGAGGVLSNVTAIFDDAGLALDETSYNTVVNLGGKPLLIATALVDNGVSVFELGGGDDVLVGTGESDLLLGLGGNDLLDGAAGNDRLLGGSGDDIYLVESSGDVVEEHGNAGTDLVRTSVSFALGANTEDLELLGSDALDGTGNELDNLLRGNGGSNELKGLVGGDRIFGADGADDLLGGKGRDHLHGGRGADDILGGKGKDILQGNAGRDDFIFTRLDDSGTSNKARDRIEGFGRNDEIVLREIDAARGRGGDQNFRLDRDGDFEAGEVGIRETKAGHIVELNVDGDAKAEMTIMLMDFHGQLDGDNFVF